MLYKNAQVPVGSDVIIDISSLQLNETEAVTCDLSMDTTWGNIVDICTTIPTTYSCNPGTQYQGRSNYTNHTTLQITGVLKNESGIYRCGKVGTGNLPYFIIAGVIIVGKFVCYNYFSFIITHKHIYNL